MLREVQKFHPNVGCHYAVGHLRAKCAKVKQVRLSSTLKNAKNSERILMDVIIFRARKIMIASAVWHLDSTYKLFKHKFAVSGAADGFSHCVMRLK